LQLVATTTTTNTTSRTPRIRQWRGGLTEVMREPACSAGRTKKGGVHTMRDPRYDDRASRIAQLDCRSAHENCVYSVMKLSPGWKKTVPRMSHTVHHLQGLSVPAPHRFSDGGSWRLISSFPPAHSRPASSLPALYLVHWPTPFSAAHVVRRMTMLSTLGAIPLTYPHTLRPSGSPGLMIVSSRSVLCAVTYIQ